MKVRNIKLTIGDLHSALDQARDTMERISSGKTVRKVRETRFTSYEAMRKILTPRRLELLHAVKSRAPRSIYALARLVGRDLKNVNDDLTVLANIGLVELRTTKGGRRNVVPEVTVDKIQLEIAV
jgi:predicted transcriptional regulator